MKRVGMELCWNPPTTAHSPWPVLAFCLVPSGASQMLAEQSSPSRSGSQFISSDPPGIAQTGPIPPPTGPRNWYTLRHLSDGVVIICGLQIEKSSRTEALSLYLLPQRLTMKGTQHTHSSPGTAGDQEGPEELGAG